MGRDTSFGSVKISNHCTKKVNNQTFSASEDQIHCFSIDMGIFRCRMQRDQHQHQSVIQSILTLKKFNGWLLTFQYG